MRSMEYLLIIAIIALPLLGFLVVERDEVAAWVRSLAGSRVDAPSAHYVAVLDDGSTFPSEWCRTREDALKACRENGYIPRAIMAWAAGDASPHMEPLP